MHQRHVCWRKQTSYKLWFLSTKWVVCVRACSLKNELQQKWAHTSVMFIATKIWLVQIKHFTTSGLADFVHTWRMYSLVVSTSSWYTTHLGNTCATAGHNNIPHVWQQNLRWTSLSVVRQTENYFDKRKHNSSYIIDPKQSTLWKTSSSN
jgi:hypothetical protein